MKKLVIIFALLLLAVGCDNTIVGQSTEMPSSTSTITTPKISNFSPGVGSVPGMGSVEPSATSSPQTSLSTNNQTNQQIKNLQNEVNQLKKQQSSPTPVQNNPSPTPTPSQPVTRAHQHNLICQPLFQNGKVGWRLSYALLRTRQVYKVLLY